jgi:hypothetical protein
VSGGPLIAPKVARDRIRDAAAEWERALEVFEVPVRLRELAAAADTQAKVVRLGELAELPWKPLAQDFRLPLPAELDPGAHRPGGPQLWAGFDRARSELEGALRGADTRHISDGYETFRDRLNEIADALQITDVADESERATA